MWSEVNKGIELTVMRHLMMVKSSDTGSGSHDSLAPWRNILEMWQRSERKVLQDSHKTHICKRDH